MFFHLFYIAVIVTAVNVLPLVSSLPIENATDSHINITIVPANALEPQSATPLYDISDFDKVYDQRQNGSENYRIDVNDVVVLWSPQQTLMAAALLGLPSLISPDYAELEEALTITKPEDLDENINEINNTSPLPSSTGAQAQKQSRFENGNNFLPSRRRKFRLPIFLRPLVRKFRTI